MDEEQLDQLFETSFDELQTKQQAAMDEFGIGEGSGGYSFDPDTCILYFSDEDGSLRCAFQTVPIGTWKENTWQWAYANEQYQNFRSSCEMIRGIADVTQLDIFREEDPIGVDEEDMLALVAVAVKALNADWMYTIPSADKKLRLFVGIVGRIEGEEE